MVAPGLRGWMLAGWATVTFGEVKGFNFQGKPSLSFRLLLAEKHNRTTNVFTTETQSAQRTHRDFFRDCGGRRSALRFSRLLPGGPGCPLRFARPKGRSCTLVWGGRGPLLGGQFRQAGIKRGHSKPQRAQRQQRTHKGRPGDLCGCTQRASARRRLAARRILSRLRGI